MDIYEKWKIILIFATLECNKTDLFRTNFCKTRTKTKTKTRQRQRQRQGRKCQEYLEYQEYWEYREYQEYQDEDGDEELRILVVIDNNS